MSIITDFVKARKNQLYNEIATEQSLEKAWAWLSGNTTYSEAADMKATAPKKYEVEELIEV